MSFVLEQPDAENESLASRGDHPRLGWFRSLSSDSRLLRLASASNSQVVRIDLISVRYLSSSCCFFSTVTLALQRNKRVSGHGAPFVFRLISAQGAKK